ncbi:hypothetical protein CHL76_09180 [Marinococcus halophilus]|uniref:Uncharacterized protein n=1 Tax=Marinococcus halophilus TaxID=1371 RepID=A0A510Y6J6_MARHA|nr:hypothetical protein [Marinococcus halophilus]OZT80268.1 hypothetical protein CHL76_09180 [Marinococcus halophilus]GEK58331.1 hypothetical protein MHA01_12360 [Marinococcus halophilus]
MENTKKDLYLKVKSMGPGVSFSLYEKNEEAAFDELITEGFVKAKKIDNNPQGVIEYRDIFVI